MLNFDFSGLGERSFELLCQAVASHVLGVGFVATGIGKDGGRDGVFEGVAHFPEEGVTWSGYAVLQAKYINGHPSTAAGTSWLLRKIKQELEEWIAPDRDRRLYGRAPEYLIFASNVNLAPDLNKGGFDRVEALIAGYAKEVGLKGWKVWDYSTLSVHIATSRSIREAFGLSTQGDVLASMHHQLTRPLAIGEQTVSG